MNRIALLACVVFLGLFGCGGSGGPPKLLDMGGEDGTKIASLIEDLNDAKGAGKKFATAFAKGATPSAAEAKKYNPFAFYIIGKPTVNGGDATAKVSIQKDGGGEIGQKEWTFVKEGDAWKLKAAPLP
jgi:hypothetical protein